MLKCSIRDLLWLLMLSALLSAWYGHYRAMVERQRAMELLIAKEQQEYYRIDAKWHEYAKQLPQQMTQASAEISEPYILNMVAQYELFIVRKRLKALGLTPPKAIDGREGGESMSPEEKQDLEIAKEEYKTVWEPKFRSGWRLNWLDN